MTHERFIPRPRWSTDRSGFIRDYGALIKTGTTPAPVNLRNYYHNQYESAFVGTDSMLWLIDPSGSPRHANGGLGVAPGTSPSIAASPNGGFQVYQIAFNANGTHHLWVVGTDNTGRDTQIILAAGPSPSLTR